MHRRVACAEGADYDGEILGRIVDKLDKEFADGVGLDEEPGVGTDQGAGLAEGLAESEERRPEVEAR